MHEYMSGWRVKNIVYHKESSGSVAHIKILAKGNKWKLKVKDKMANKHSCTFIKTAMIPFFNLISFYKIIEKYNIHAMVSCYIMLEKTNFI